jgi:DNA-binding NtrC family response regulator
LRAVENHEVQSVGSYQSYQVDVRLVAATNRNLRSMVAAGTFREDLFHRLNAVSVATPALRECRGAIGALVAHFVDLHSREAGKTISHISGRALRMLLGYDWPGNVRELSHAIQSTVLMADKSRIDAEDLPACVQLAEEALEHDDTFQHDDTIAVRVPRATTILEAPGADVLDGSTALDSLTRAALMRSLEQTRGNRQQAAKLLGISRQKLYRMIARYDLAQTGRLSV